MSDRVGFWADMDNPYVTYHNDYIESVWWALRQIWDKGLLYKGHKIMPYCPRCGTALSSHEVAQGYKDVKENSIIVKFQIKDAPKGEYILGMDYHAMDPSLKCCPMRESVREIC